ncbi:hypothetical protein HYH03_013979 [Edaphochlamys debaryana]|uniref:Uncharacterized protein n=1 Tax=Edaphochlamys debaryana TaxID=47281 RepID=A0A835XPS5_9CHLO|nr:hypothetical protein HYH03_013979 [Edaphochlamys debaryana]|eukprot:KAG2487410.1 hypothetical protein HYH03_013979 [Edaphochlamys debaryana]
MRALHAEPSRAAGNGPAARRAIPSFLNARLGRRSLAAASGSQLAEPSLLKEPAAEPSTSTSEPCRASWNQACSRRHAALGAAAILASPLAATGPAQAIKAVTLRDGTVVSAAEHGMTIAIVALRGSVPATTATDFKESIGKYCGFSLDQRSQLGDIFKELSDTTGKNKRSSGIADAVTLGDAWLAPAVARGLVQPLRGAEGYRWWRLLPERMRQLVRRNPVTGLADPNGLVFGAPYRWGATLVAYRRDRLLRRGGTPLLDWSDLLQPSLKGRIAMTDSPRELLAAALRSLGLGANAGAAELAAAGLSEQDLKDRVAALRAQVRLFSSRDHCRALQAGDVWAVVGDSSDLVLVAERSGNVELVSPLSGTQLWADVWAVPSGARGGHRQQGPSPLLAPWIEFTLSPGRVTGQPGLKGGAPVAMLPDPGTSPATANSVLAAIHQHREHLLQAHAAANPPGGPLGVAIRGLAATTGGAGISGIPLLRPFLDDPRGGAAAAGTSLAAAASEAEREAAAAAARRDAWMYPAVALQHDRCYLPPPPVLARSDFLLPRDEATMELYRRVLGE